MPVAVDNIPAEVVVTIDPLSKKAGVDGIPANGFIVTLPDEVAGKTAAGFDGIAAEVYNIPAEVVTVVDVEVVVTIDPLSKTAGVDGIPADRFIVTLPDEVAGKTAAAFDGIAAEVYATYLLKL